MKISLARPPGPSEHIRDCCMANAKGLCTVQEYGSGNYDYGNYQ